MKPRLFIATDIFGQQPFVMKLASDYLEQGYETLIVSPYNEKRRFKSEKDAYQSFVDCGGMDAYIKKLKVLVAKSETNPIMLGFSAGASAIWALSGDYQFSRTLLFYPGQIRHYLEVAPKSPVRIVFPRAEAHFDLTTVINKLHKINGVESVKTPLEHGFFNPMSLNYSSEYSTPLNQFLRVWPKLTESESLTRLERVFTSNGEGRIETC